MSIKTGPRQTEWRIPRKRMQKLGSQHSHLESFAEQAVQEHYTTDTVTIRGADTSDYDLFHVGRETVYEVKSCQTEVRSGDKPDGTTRRTEGRFLVFEQQLERLLQYQDRDDSTAWFVFVLFDDRGTLLDRRRMFPTTVKRVVDEGDYEATTGHKSGRRYKIPASEIFPYLDDD